MAFITRGQSVGNGAQTTFTLTSTSGVPIPYLAQADIIVTVNDVVKTLTTDYTFSGDGLSIIFNVAPAAVPVGWQRKSNAAPSVFGLLPQASTPSTGDLNRILRRVVYICQECYDGIVAGGAIALLGSGSWDAGSRKITNVANGVNPTDALTVGQLTGFAGTGTITNLATAGLASGGPITSTGTVTVTAATQAQALLAVSTSTALTPNSLVPLLVQGADIASVAALPIGIDGNSFNVTGTVAVTSLNQGSNLVVGRTVLLTFKGALTLTHNATNLPLPGGASITTANGDTATFKYESGTSPQVWRCMNYQRASGLPIVNPTVTPGILTVSYDSGQQTITAAGALTLAHSLGVKPKVVMAFLVNTVAEQGYSIGDEVAVALGEQNLNRGFALVADATNLNVRYGADANTFILLNKGTGNGISTITNTSWRLILRAYA